MGPSSVRSPELWIRASTAHPTVAFWGSDATQCNVASSTSLSKPFVARSASRIYACARVSPSSTIVFVHCKC